MIQTLRLVSVDVPVEELYLGDRAREAATIPQPGVATHVTKDNSWRWCAPSAEIWRRFGVYPVYRTVL
jgi:hypothetical protein